jgi:hypothetical protein
VDERSGATDCRDIPDPARRFPSRFFSASTADLSLRTKRWPRSIRRRRQLYDVVVRSDLGFEIELSEVEERVFFFSSEKARQLVVVDASERVRPGLDVCDEVTLEVHAKSECVLNEFCPRAGNSPLDPEVAGEM